MTEYETLIAESLEVDFWKLTSNITQKTSQYENDSVIKNGNTLRYTELM